MMTIVDNLSHQIHDDNGTVDAPRLIVVDVPVRVDKEEETETSSQADLEGAWPEELDEDIGQEGDGQDIECPLLLGVEDEGDPEEEGVGFAEERVVDEPEEGGEDDAGEHEQHGLDQIHGHIYA